MEEAKDMIMTLLADNGYVVSQKRRVIIDILCKKKYIQSVDDFWWDIRRQHNISWATVYNTIRLLVQIGCIIRADTESRQQQFTLCV